MPFCQQKPGRLTSPHELSWLRSPHPTAPARGPQPAATEGPIEGSHLALLSARKDTVISVPPAFLPKGKARYKVPKLRFFYGTVLWA